MTTVRPGTAPPRARGRTARRAVAPLAAALFFFGPALAFAAGDRAVEIENRRLPDFPALSRGWDVIPDAEAWTTAHLPLRRYAVRADAALSELLFGHAPSHARAGRPGYPRVVEGRDGWLYFGDDVTEACRPRRPVAATLERLRRLAEIVRGSGRRFLVAVAPDKTTVYPGRLPDRFPGQDCLGERKREFWAALRAARLPGYVDLRGPLERTQRDSGAPAYWRTDSHWTERSAGLYGAELARALDAGLSQHTRLVRAGQGVRDGDLGRLLGVPREETVERWRLDRDGVRRLRQDDSELPVSFRTANASARAPLYRRRTLLIGDSFTRNSLPWVLPYFADLTYLRSDASATAGPEQVARKVAASETVVVEIVERHLVGGHAEILDDAVLAALERAL
ncbi:alginate O-acetyltransferase AlgX-related protein [Sphaerisporangium dianthi]|uniref:AlgX/AlgJ SGNH hydrolase-like domain-containing protein n=1 Tax=Sphaerisporangium dianthi TaxID=1436120 RepID=A0ABV9CD52_9ACTN